MPDHLNPQFEPLPNDSEPFRTIPHSAEAFGNVPNGSASFRTVPQPSELKSNHTLTVRDVARMFEAAGVARTERSITNWCQANRSGVSRLDAYFDPNERKYFLTTESVERAIAEEKARAAKTTEASESVGNIPQDAERHAKRSTSHAEAESDQVRELEHKVKDLEINNRVKDRYIEKLKEDSEGFAMERQRYVAELMSSSRKLGELETKLLQIESPSRTASEDVPGGI